jgi:hypothetical protein
LIFISKCNINITHQGGAVVPVRVLDTLLTNHHAGREPKNFLPVLFFKKSPQDLDDYCLLLDWYGLKWDIIRKS